MSNKVRFIFYLLNVLANIAIQVWIIFTITQIYSLMLIIILIVVLRYELNLLFESFEDMKK